MKVFVYPTGGQGPVSSNPYIRNMKETMARNFELVEPRYRVKLPRMLVFLLNSFKADVYVLNWIEDSAVERGGLTGALMSLTGLYIAKLRKAKLVWIFHNIHSHAGETAWTRRFRLFLFKNASLIIAHSREAETYAIQQSKCPVYFKHHPLKVVDYGKCQTEVDDCDFFYWSTILPYKGVVEFLSAPSCLCSGRKIILIGKCKDDELSNKIESLTNHNIKYENRNADFSEIAAYCQNAKYVIFPYVGDSISSSGVLIDTLLMGGTPVGPNRGAFADLAAIGCCITYNNIDEVFNLPVEDNQRLRLDPIKINAFIKENSWDAFGHWFKSMITRL